MSRRARRGLADLSDSEEDECMNRNVDSTKENSVSLFDTKVFTEKVLSTIRDEEDKVTSLEGLENRTGPNGSILISEDDRPLKQKRSSVCSRAKKRSRLLEVLSSDDETDDEFEELCKSTSDSTSMIPRQQSNDTIDLDSEDKEDEIRRKEDEDEELLANSFDENDDLNAEDQNDYRVLVKHLGVDESIWVRLKENETMQRVFDETRNATGVDVTLMIDVNGEREEVLPTQTAIDLKMSVERCAVVYSYPVPTTCTFKLKIVTTNRRATKEIACEIDESFAQIFQRYCEQNDLSRSSLVFKFDGDVLDDTQTPQDHDMESGEQIEAHSFIETKSSDQNSETIGLETRSSARLRNR